MLLLNSGDPPRPISASAHNRSACPESTVALRSQYVDRGGRSIHQWAYRTRIREPDR